MPVDGKHPFRPDIFLVANYIPRCNNLYFYHRWYVPPLRLCPKTYLSHYSFFCKVSVRLARTWMWFHENISAVSSCRVVISLEHYADREECRYVLTRSAGLYSLRKTIRNKKSNQLDNTAEKGVSVACTEQNGRPHGAVFSTLVLFCSPFE